MKKFFFGVTLLTTILAHSADDIYAYNYWAYTNIQQYMQEVSQTASMSNFSIENANKCAPVYKNALNRGVLDIRYALGYFDDSQGIDIVWDGKNYGISPSLDIGVFNSLRHFMTDKCDSSKNLLLCGFKESGDPSQGKLVLEKEINMMGKPVLARITLTHASASESYTDNLGKFSARQKFLTQQSEENYFGGIGVADFVIYNGHSRDGGGPDFNPPILAKDLHTDYHGYYHIKKPGIKRVLELIRKSPNKDTTLAFFSCFSKMHFYNDMMKTNPKQRVIFSAEKIDYFDSLKASVGYLEGFLRGQCGQELADIAKQGEKIKAGFQGFQIR